MDTNNLQSNVIDPWYERKGRFSTIIFVLLSVVFIFAVYDGATFYARFQQLCIDQPHRTECKGFATLISVPSKPKLDIVLDYGSGKYAIQIGAYKSESQAKDAIAQLQAYDIQPRIIKVKDDKRKVLYKVQLGRFSEQKIASQTAQQLKSKGIIQNYIVTNYNKDKF